MSVKATVQQSLDENIIPIYLLYVTHNIGSSAIVHSEAFPYICSLTIWRGGSSGRGGGDMVVENRWSCVYTCICRANLLVFCFLFVEVCEGHIIGHTEWKSGNKNIVDGNELPFGVDG